MKKHTKLTMLEQIRSLFNKGLTLTVTIFALVINILFGLLQLYNERTILSKAQEQSSMIDETSYYEHIQVVDSDSPLALKINQNSKKLSRYLYFYEDNRYLFKETPDVLLLRGINHLHQRQIVLLIVSLIVIFFTRIVAKKISRTITKRFAHHIRTIAQYVRYSSFSDQQSPLTLVDVADHDELKTIAKAINKKNKEILGQVQVMQDFIAHVQHEFKTPITSLALTNEIALEESETKPLAEENLRYTQQLNRILDALLLFVEVDIGNKKLEKCDVELIIKELADQIEKKHQTKRIVEIKKEDQTSIYVHRGTLETILVNLIDNAWKYSDEDSHITIDVTKDGIRIKDEGKGIHENEKGLIRSPFWQGDSSKSKDQGLGLGLAIVKKYADYRGRKIQVESKKNVGTTFTLQR